MRPRERLTVSREAQRMDGWREGWRNVCGDCCLMDAPLPPPSLPQTPRVPGWTG